MTPAAAERRIVHLFDSFGPGERSERAAAVINGWKAPLRHTIVAADGDYAASALLKAGLKLGYPTDFPAIGPLLSPGHLLRLARRLAPYDLILTYGYGAIGGALAHSLFGPRAGLAPMIHHEFADTNADARRLRPKLIRRLALARAHAIVVADAAGAARAERHWQQPPGRIRLIPPGVASARISRQARRGAIPRVVKRTGEHWIGYAGSLDDQVTLRGLLDALEQLDPHWHLVLIGEGAGGQALRERAIGKALGHRLHLAGAVADVVAAMAAFDVFAVGPADAGGARVIAAMAAGLPVLGTAGAGLESVLSRANVVELAADAGGLGNLASRWADDPKQRAEIGAANRRLAQERHDLEAMVAAHIALYQPLLERDPAA